MPLSLGSRINLWKVRGRYQAAGKRSRRRTGLETVWRGRARKRRFGVFRQACPGKGLGAPGGVGGRAGCADRSPAQTRFCSFSGISGTSDSEPPHGLVPLTWGDPVRGGNALLRRRRRPWIICCDLPHAFSPRRVGATLLLGSEGRVGTLCVGRKLRGLCHGGVG